MARGHPNDTKVERGLLVALAVCCVVPMTVILLASSLLGLTLGSAVAAAVGLTAAGLCVAVMSRHRHSRRRAGSTSESS
ncbi:hypothetical protein [Rhabdothermincola sp.]|uniref:hypothetical protein n=1 Tax=Rhabdothermincola sp. TaxID=2820405 RepID=UPI002FE053C4